MQNTHDNKRLKHGLYAMINRLSVSLAGSLAAGFSQIGTSRRVLHLITLGLIMIATLLPFIAAGNHALSGFVIFVALLLNLSNDLKPGPDHTVKPVRPVTNYLRYTAYALFTISSGVLAYINSQNRYYLFAGCFVLVLWGCLVLIIHRVSRGKSEQVTGLLSAKNIRQLQKNNDSFRDSLLLSTYPYIKKESLPVFVLLVSLLNNPAFTFKAGALVLTVTIAGTFRLLAMSDDAEARQISRNGLSFVFYLVGIVIILLLVARLPFNELLEVVDTIGPEVLWLVIFPVVWIIPYSMTLPVLLDNRISFRNALYTQISGDAFNSIIPLLGMGGEPYKAKHLSRFVPLNDSSRAIVQSRLIHALSGVLYTFLVIAACLYLFSLESVPGLRFALWSVAISMLVAAILLVWVTMSRAPSKFTGIILSRFKLIEEVRHDKLSWSKLIHGTALRLLGRCGKFLELLLIFAILDQVPHFAEAVLVESLIMASVSIFFFIPHGLGVNEAGILTALSISGYSAALGVVFGLVRRARMVLYALVGLAVYTAGTVYYARRKV